MPWLEKITLTIVNNINESKKGDKKSL